MDDALARTDSPRCRELHEGITALLRRYGRRIEYGNLRSRVTDWEADEGVVLNIALVYETPGGSTDQINVTYDCVASEFTMVDEEGETVTDDPALVLARLTERVQAIPGYRRERLLGEVSRQIGGGISRAGLVGHLNRMLQDQFRGGAITYNELHEAIAHAVRSAAPGASAKV
jgi:hypothetical protein